jgi:N-acetylmuramoyl-L-alanine amidase
MTEIPETPIERRFGYRPDRRTLIKIAAGILFAPATAGELFADPPPAFRIRNRYSPENRKRAQRPSTKFIILHTTEGPDKGSLNVVRHGGLANYLVSTSGVVYRIIDKRKIAKHAGRSMWDGLTTIDNYSIGIEVVGYHDKNITNAQYDALRELLRQLQSLYDIPDDHVLTHSMVAYGVPNRFHHYNHRGRKTCGMIFAQPEVRARLGLESQPDHDPDVRAGRLKNADKKLAAFLFPEIPKPVLVASSENTVPTPSPRIEIPDTSYVISGSNSAWDIAREYYNHPSTLYTFPNGTQKSGDEIENWNRIPAGTRVALNEMDDSEDFEGFLEIGKDGDMAEELAGELYASSNTIYFFPSGLIRTGAELQEDSAGRALLEKTPRKTLMLVGYIYGGRVTANRPAANIAGRKWNYPSTYYRYPDGKILSGDDINPQKIPRNTFIFFQQ